MVTIPVVWKTWIPPAAAKSMILSPEQWELVLCCKWSQIHITWKKILTLLKGILVIPRIPCVLDLQHHVSAITCVRQITPKYMDPSLWTKLGQCNHRFVIWSFNSLDQAPVAGAPNDYTLIIWLGCKKGSYWIPSHTLHKATMARENSNRGASGSLPHTDGVVKAAAGKQSIIWWPPKIHLLQAMDKQPTIPTI